MTTTQFSTLLVTHSNYEGRSKSSELGVDDRLHLGDILSLVRSTIHYKLA